MHLWDCESGPRLTLRLRLHHSLAYADLTPAAMAAVLCVEPGSVNRWLAGTGPTPCAATLARWAAATLVPVEWLTTGVAYRRVT